MSRLSRILRSTDQALKRGLDLVLGGTTLLALVPGLPLLAAAIRADSAGPIFFRCQRLGKDGKVIELWKFRTMIHDAPEKFNADGSRLVEANDARVTRVGAILRGGLDELPQAWSVLKGELSFVGPRPDDVFATDLYRGAEWLKLSVTPGITGLAQINGRNDLPYRERLKYDIYYAHHRNVLLDLRILMRTALLAAGLEIDEPVVDPLVVEAYAARRDVLEAGQALAARVQSAPSSRS